MATLITRVNGNLIQSPHRQIAHVSYRPYKMDVFDYTMDTRPYNDDMPQNVDALLYELQYAADSSQVEIGHVQRNSIAQIVVPDFPHIHRACSEDNAECEWHYGKCWAHN